MAGEAGAANTSAAVSIAIAPADPPRTNQAETIVTIDATDPVALARTNCWTWLGLSNASPSWSAWLSSNSFCWETNCGPKDATITVTRYATVSNDLTLSYTVSGTALPGIDYAPLSNSITIPAGEESAPITIIPLDSGDSESEKTVVLSLAVRPQAPYLAAPPGSAAALIVDNDPTPTALIPQIAALSGGAFHIRMAGPDGAWFHLDYSTDLFHWTTVCTNQVVNGFIDFIDPDADQATWRAYRAVPMTGPGH